jgi:hypothetical protein
VFSVFFFWPAKMSAYPGRICLQAPAVDVGALHRVAPVHRNGDGLRESLGGTVSIS